MTPEQLAEYQQLLDTGKNENAGLYAYPRGWNDALEFAKQMLLKAKGEDNGAQADKG
jgi:hypothetical protein